MAITRRKLVLGIGATAAVGVAAAGGVAWKKFRPLKVSNRPEAPDAVVRDYRVKLADGTLPELVVVRDPDPAAATEKAIAELGGLAKFIGKGDRVVIKPNIGWVRTVAQAGNTHPAVVAMLVRLSLQAGAKRVIVIDGSCDQAAPCYEKSGIAKAASDAGAEVILPAPELYRETLMRSRQIDSWPMLEPILTADKIINVPIAKHHGMAKYTGAMKNWFGLMGGERGRLHWDLQLMVAELARFIRPTLNVIDASRVLIRNGPRGGNLDDVEEKNTIVASVDPVAADAYGCTLIGKKPEDLDAIRIARELGVGNPDWRSLRHKII